MKYSVLVAPVVGAILMLGGYLVFGNLNDNLVYYLKPAEAIAKRADFPDGKRFRLGGYVEKGSVDRTASGLRFTVSGGGAAVRVAFTGSPAQLFRPGIGVVVEGAWQGEVFRGDTMIIKHDSDYRPPSSSKQPTGQENAS